MTVVQRTLASTATAARSAAPSTSVKRPSAAGAADSSRSAADSGGPTEALASTVARRLATRIGAGRFDRWFDADTTRFEVEGEDLRIDAANHLVAEWIGRHFAGALEEVARETIGAAATVSMRVCPERFGADPGEERTASPAGRGDAVAFERASTKPGSRRESVPPGRFDPTEPPAGERTEQRGPQSAAGALPRAGRGDRRPVFRRLEEFVAGPSNQLAFDVARRIGECDPPGVSMFFVHGDCGVGKTHLLQGICERRREIFPRERIRYTTAEQFTNEYLTALRESSLDRFRTALRKLDLLAIDDIHFLSNKTATQAEFLHTIDAIDLSGARLVLASDEHPRQIRKFSQSLISRFLSGMVVRIERPDRATRLSLVRRLAAARGLSLQPAAEEMVANRAVGSVREIEGALARLAACASLLGDSGEVGALVTERAFEEHGGRPSGPVRLTDIVETVCARMGIARDDVIGGGRHRRVVLARGVIVHLARELTTQSFPEIARILGRDTHSTAHSGAKRIEQMLAAGERVEAADSEQAGADGRVPLSELIAQLRHDVLRATPRS